MSLPSNPLPEYVESAPLAPPVVEQPLDTTPTVIVGPAEKPFPAWSGWDVLAILVFTLVAILVFTIGAMFVAHALPRYHNATFTDLATNAAVVIGAQTAAYPIVLLFIFLMVRTRSRQGFGKAIQWNWPGVTAPAFLIGGVVLALAVEGMARFLPIPKSLPMDAYFHDATSAYMMAAFGMTLAPLLEELFFRGLLYPLLRRAFGLIVAVLLSGGVRCHPWCSVRLCLGSGVQHLCGWRGVHRGADTDQLRGRFLSDALWVQLCAVCSLVAGQRSLSTSGEGDGLDRIVKLWRQARANNC